jgi:hypothetical protein
VAIPVAGASPTEHPNLKTALLLGVFSLGCFGFLTGIPGLFISLRAKRDIDRSRGTLAGEGKAIAGILASFIGTIGSLAICVMIGGSAVQTALEDKTLFKNADVGAIKVLVVAKRHGRLAEALSEAAKAGKPVMMQTRFRTCDACDEFQNSLNDSSMQDALQSVVLVRVEVDTFHNELAQMKINTSSAPWFYKLDSKLTPTDGISGGEWDANVPANMAPVLSAFVRGTLSTRREVK